MPVTWPPYPEMAPGDEGGPSASFTLQTVWWTRLVQKVDGVAWYRTIVRRWHAPYYVHGDGASRSESIAEAEAKLAAMCLTDMTVREELGLPLRGRHGR